MDLILIGTNYKKSPIELREKLSFSDSEIIDFLNKLKNSYIIKEALILSTCNRTEFYFVSDPDNIDIINEIICNDKDITPDEIKKFFYTYHKDEVVKHLYEVISGLDSMILGEHQILGQVKDAYSLSCEAKSSGIILNKLMHSAFSIGKRVRNETCIGLGNVSVASVAVGTAKKTFIDLTGHSALLIGAGAIGEATADNLSKNNIGKLYITNRTYERAELLASKLNAEPINFDKMKNIIKKVDIIITSIASKEFLLTRCELEKSIKGKNETPLFIIDLGMPRNIDPKISEIPNVTLHHIDSLKEIVDSNKEKRSKEIPKVKSVIDEELKKFMEWYEGLPLNPIIHDIKEKLEEIRLVEINKNIMELSKDEAEKFNDISKQMLNKAFSLFINKLKQIKEINKLSFLNIDDSEDADANR